MVRSRGQLLLIGAVLLGMTIVGTVVMLNGMQYTDSAGAQSQSQVLDDAERNEEMVVRDMELLVRQVDADMPFRYEEAVIANVSTYNNYTRNMTVTRGGALINVSVNESRSDGTRIHQPASGGPTNDNFQRTGSGPGTPNDWSLASDVEKVAGFRVNTTKIDGGPMNAFTVRIENDTAGYVWEMKVYSQSAMDYRLKTRYTDSGSLPLWGTTPVECASSDEEIDIRLVDGTAAKTNNDCEFTSFTDRLTSPYDIKFKNGNRAHGTYNIFITGSASGNVDPGDTDDYVVNPAIDFQYRSTELAYNRTIQIDSDSP